MAVNRMLKCLLLTLNFLFFICGAVVLGVSAHASSNRTEYQITDELLPAVHLMVGVGAITLVVGFLGCCGAAAESRCLLALFFLGLLAMLLMLLAVGVLGAMARTDTAQDLVRAQFEKLGPLAEAPTEVQESFQSVERAGQCCGFFKGHEDWSNSSLEVPDSCNCTDTSKNCTALLDGRDVFATPCLPYLLTWLDRVSGALMGVAFALAAVMVIGMAFSLALMCQVSVGNKSII
ncbi:tetraspanin-8-like [Gadus chalcogrammus]|uniref:tetraspanin-8-like n=1 Tax=Gadus chalcogrammus TaxID=1042646 RepID=UPI0024C495D8|nr:tetraspanin-8-like [Gadus chalcogrammus]